MTEIETNKIENRRRTIATTISITTGIVGASLIMIGVFGELSIAGRIILLAFGAAAVIAAPIANLIILRMSLSGKILKILLLIEDIIERNLIHKFAAIYHYGFGIIKVLLGIFTRSYFLVVSAFYSLCFGVAKTTYIRGVKLSDGDISKDYRYYAKVGWLIILGSFVYGLYMSRLFFIKQTASYGMTIGIAIAAISFTELILAIINLSKSRDLLSSAVRKLSLASSFLAIALTQVAITSFADVGDSSFSNALTSVIFSALAMITGGYMVIKSFVYKRNNR